MGLLIIGISTEIIVSTSEIATCKNKISVVIKSSISLLSAYSYNSSLVIGCLDKLSVALFFVLGIYFTSKSNR